MYHNETLAEIVADLHQRGVQSLLVEGGSRLLQSFIDEGLWDEARVEEAPCLLAEGVKAPVLSGMGLMERQQVDGRWISSYERAGQ